MDGVPDFSTIIAQQLQNLLPTIMAQVGNHGNNPENIINDNIQGDVRNVIVNNERRGCTYKEFLACNPKEYDGKGGAIVHTRRIEKMESVQDMSGCRDNQKMKYTAGLFMGKALTWWNSQIHTRSREAVVGMTREDFKTLMREESCPSNEMQKLETELWNHAMVGAGHAAYTDRFHELARLVPHLVTLEKKKIERYLAGALTDEAIRNGSIKKNPEKRGNVGEPSKDKNGKDDNKRTRTGNAFATTSNPVRRENTGGLPEGGLPGGGLPEGGLPEGGLPGLRSSVYYLYFRIVEDCSSYINVSESAQDRDVGGLPEGGLPGGGLPEGGFPGGGLPKQVAV
ncbi:reverse transcriptase domain-containing protein [Tanacetum coccineum]